MLTVLLLIACTPPAPCSPGASPPSNADLLPLPALAEGSHLGLWATYERPPAAQRQALAAHEATLRAAGMQIARLHLSWGDLEWRRGRFNLDQLDVQLGLFPGASHHLLIETVDSDGLTMPRDLVDDAGAYRLAEGRRFDDPVITDRFACLLDALLPALADVDVFSLSVANEPDARLDDLADGSEAARDWIEALAGFQAAARDHVHAARPELAVGLTLREGSLGGEDDLSPILASADVAVWNVYCQGPDFQVQPANTLPARFDALLAASGDRPVVVQEFGCPAGQATVGGSEAMQADFYAEMGRQVATRPRLRAAFGFQLLDWSPRLSSRYGRIYANEGYPELGAQVEESLATMGLLRWEDGSERPAWGAFLGAVEALEAQGR